MKYFVSRQMYWGVDEPLVVEIAGGGVEYANPDMLSDARTEFSRLGSGEEYTDPREALEAAFRVRDAWNRMLDGSEECARVEVGYTGGNTIPFEEYPTDEQLRTWAQKAWDALPKCDWCGHPLPKNPWTLPDDPDLEFCSEYCAEEAYDEMMQEAEHDDYYGSFPWNQPEET